MSILPLSYTRPSLETPAMTAAIRSNPALWARIKNKWLKSATGTAGVWNARKAMLAVQEYKRRGGGYIGVRSQANSLKKWEREKWGYIDGNPAGRYLPAAVRAALTPAEKRREMALKKGRAGEWVPYSASVNAKMRRAGIYAPKPARPKPARPKPARPKPARPKPARPKPARPKPARPKPARPKPPRPRNRRCAV